VKTKLAARVRRRRAPSAARQQPHAGWAACAGRERPAQTVLLVVVALVVWGLKRHYADARADELWWILHPTARLVGLVSGATFTVAPGEGYVSHERLFLIEKSCAGVNFMIAAFGMVVFALLGRVRSGGAGLSVLALGLGASYGAAVLVNTVRISVAMWLAAHPVPVSIVTAADVHRLEGIAVYFIGLVLLYELVRRLERVAPGAECRA
jgi:exosortase K